MRSTIYTVAERAGVSIATVSRVMNDSPKVSDATRSRVLAAIAELGFQPNAAARGLAGNTTGTLALAFPQLSGPFYSELIRGAEVRARAAGYHLLIYGTEGGGTNRDQQQVLEALVTKVDGLILAHRSAGPETLRDLAQRGLPIVVMGEMPDALPLDSIQPDNLGGAVRAVTHLIQHGYRQIGFISGPRDQAHANDRLLGYRRALQAHARPLRPELIAAAAFDEGSGYAAMAELIDRVPELDAIFAANDQMAIGAMAAARDRGRRVPADVAIVGFDDVEAARYLQPSLTTVRQDISEQGQLAVELLLNRLADPRRPVQTEVISTSLVVRQSCGCLAAQ